ncbi:MFS transporter [Actinomadura rugatobispora]|uniref:MFS transporter n=1 Tax=Actinomadura rugatobispora TaxID=1994 RepID=A0ABW0ZZH5_9ACTN|nr:MFS transporter [Actinomadura rugatobispora]
MGLRAGADAVGRSVRSGARGAARVARSTGRAARRAGGFTRRAANAQGAGRSGLGTLIESTAVHSAGDAMVAVALAGTLFFGLDVAQARGQVALYLLVTMAPFALVAPLIGPVLDRMRHARRYAIAGTFAARGLLCWGMAAAVPHGDEVTFLPAAFGVLVLSKAFGVLRAAVTPRVLPDGITLVTANARAAFAGLITATVTVPVVAGLGVLVGTDWLLRLATATFLAGVILTMRLPRKIDVPDNTPETTDTTETAEAAEPSGAGGVPDGDRPRKRRGRAWRTLPRVGPVVSEAMLANAALRAFSGFLILYLAFLLREESFEQVAGNVALGLLAGAAGAGGLAGTALGAWMKARAPRLIVLGTLAFVTATAAAAAVLFGLWAALGVAAAAGLGQSLGKLSMDAVVQREIGEEVRSSTFAVSETLHQLVWVLGGLLGLGLSIVASGRIAMSAVAAALALALAALLIRSSRDARRARRSRTARAQDSAGRPSGPAPAAGTSPEIRA